MAPGEITLENDSLIVRILPGRGGKMASLKDRQTGFDVLYRPQGGYPPLEPGMPFDRGDASGFDDVFPSMGESYRGAAWDVPLDLPDHGEVWTSPMDVKSVSRCAAEMHFTGRMLPYAYTKSILLEGRTVHIRIRIRNTGRKDLPLLWVCHCLMRLEEDTVLEFPPGAAQRLYVPGCSDAGPAVPPPEGHTMKFYFADPVREGICAACYPGHGMRAEMRFDAARLPWLGFWITTGGWRGEKNFAFEPATAFYDTWTCAEKYGRLPRLMPGEEAEMRLSLSLSPIRP